MTLAQRESKNLRGRSWLSPPQDTISITIFIWSMDPPKASKTPDFGPKYPIIRKKFACGAHNYVFLKISRFPRSFRRGGGSNLWYSTDTCSLKYYRELETRKKNKKLFFYFLCSSELRRSWELRFLWFGGMCWGFWGLGFTTCYRTENPMLSIAFWENSENCLENTVKYRFWARNPMIALVIPHV